MSQSDYSRRPMPFSSDPVPKFLERRGIGRIGYGEYAAQTILPIPVEAALKEAWESQGMSEPDIQRWLRAIAVGSVEGATGARVSPDRSTEPKPVPTRKKK